MFILRHSRVNCLGLIGMMWPDHISQDMAFYVNTASLMESRCLWCKDESWINGVIPKRWLSAQNYHIAIDTPLCVALWIFYVSCCCLTKRALTFELKISKCFFYSSQSIVPNSIVVLNSTALTRWLEKYSWSCSLAVTVFLDHDNILWVECRLQFTLCFNSFESLVKSTYTTFLSC